MCYKHRNAQHAILSPQYPDTALSRLLQTVHIPNTLPDSATERPTLLYDKDWVFFWEINTVSPVSQFRSSGIWQMAALQTGSSQGLLAVSFLAGPHLGPGPHHLFPGDREAPALRTSRGKPYCPLPAYRTTFWSTVVSWLSSTSK